MSAPNVSVPYREFVSRANRHDVIVIGLKQIEPRLQRLLAELVMMRLFDDFQAALSGIAVRLACGAAYADGRMPALLTTPARSTTGAKDLFEHYGRTKRKYAQWSRAGYITDTTELVIDPRDPFASVCNANSLVISEMQAVRNRIAHRNATSLKNYSNVVRRHYGARIPSLSPGMLLLSPRFSPTLLENYIAACRVILKGCSGH